MSPSHSGPIVAAGAADNFPLSSGTAVALIVAVAAAAADETISRVAVAAAPADVPPTISTAILDPVLSSDYGDYLHQM